MFKQAHIYIFGDVIGVGFRAWTKIQAKKFEVKGWVCNNYDRNCVEGLLQGPAETLEKMIGQLREGPPVANVDNIEVSWEEPKEKFEFFEII